MPTHEELIAWQREEADVAKAIGADKMLYQTLPDLIDACMETKHCLPEEFDCSVFNGCYVTGDIDEDYLARLLASRKDEKRTRISPLGKQHNAND